MIGALAFLVGVLFPLAINKRIRTGTGNGNPTV